MAPVQERGQGSERHEIGILPIDIRLANKRVFPSAIDDRVSSERLSLFSPDRVHRTTRFLSQNIST